MAVNAESRVSEPRPTLSVPDGVALIMGVVIGVGIFKTPSLVAANAGGSRMFLLAWLLGGVISLIGALCYAELATAYPHAGGDYHYLFRAFGGNVAFLFSWARMTVIQTGSIAMLAFVFGDYASGILKLGPSSASIFAALAVVLLTGLNVLGIRQAKWTQNLLTAGKVVGLLLVVAAGIIFVAPRMSSGPTPPVHSGAFGLAMVFVLLTYGGWNEAAYISAELRDARRNMLRTLLWSIGLITAIYLLINVAYLRGLGLSQLSGSETVAADLIKRAANGRGASVISLLIAFSALGTVSATIFTGARTNYAMGRNTRLFSLLGHWHERANAPVNSLIVQGLISLALVLLSTVTRKGFATMVEYTAPVFWFFFLLTGISLFVLRVKEGNIPRPFRVPLYPVLPVLFCGTCGYMLYSSLAYTGVGAMVGVGVLAAGIPFLLVSRRRDGVSG